MNHFVPQQKETIETKGITTIVCPKPNPTRQFIRWKFCQQNEPFDSNVGTELIDIIVENKKFSSSPPYFIGSPPVRASNPLIQDEKFRCEKHISQSTNVISSSPSDSFGNKSSPSCSPLRKGGCVRMKFGAKAKVRVVGFDCHVPSVAY